MNYILLAIVFAQSLFLFKMKLKNDYYKQKYKERKNLILPKKRLDI